MKFIAFGYWFNLYPGALIPWAQNGLIVFILFLVGLAFLAKRFGEEYKFGLSKFVWGKLRGFSVVNATFGAILLFFAYQAIPFFSSRFWFLIWGASMAIYLRAVYNKDQANQMKRFEHEAKEENSKYTPKKKKN